jgi:hypothetical protein
LKKSIKSSRYTFFALAFACALFNSGCQPQLSSHSAAENDNSLDASAAYMRYAPAKLDIIPLTQYVPADQTHRPHINIYVSLLNPFGTQIIFPGVFRFELYEHVQRSAKPKGKRLALWPDADLTTPMTNNEYWRDHLRAYEFTVPLDQSNSKSHILQATYFCPTGKLITSEFTLRKTQ